MVTVAVVVALSVGVAAGAAVVARFSDVPEHHWAAKTIEWAVGNGIMRERGEDLFEPGKPGCAHCSHSHGDIGAIQISSPEDTDSSPETVTLEFTVGSGGGQVTGGRQSALNGYQDRTARVIAVRL